MTLVCRNDIRKEDLVWIPISVAWTSTLAHWKYGKYSSLCAVNLAL